MLEAKLSGEELAKPAPPEPETPVVDLMDALKRSVAEAQGRKTASAAPSKKRTGAKDGSSKARRTPARKSA
jgi:non-homologous end joining protein Ku